MEFPALDQVECAILHDEFAPIDGRELFNVISKLAVGLKFAPEVQLMVTSSHKDIHVHAGGYRILVSQNETPLGMGGFRTALTTPYTGIVFPDAHNAVQRHKANTFVTVAKGVLPTSDPEIGGMLQNMLGDEFKAMQAMNQITTYDEAELAMLLCRGIAQFIVQRHKASAIHWCTSDNLVSQDFFERFANDKDFVMLGSRPYLTSSAGRIGEGLPVGALFNGSQWLIGKMIQFEEAPVSVPWMLEAVFAFTKMCLIRGSVFPHNQSFSVEGQDWTIGVYHEPPLEGTRWGIVKLVVIDAPEFGIRGDTSAKTYHRYENDHDIRARAEAEKNEVRAANDVAFEDPNTINPQDDFDIAIAEKLRKRKLAEEAAGSVRQENAYVPEQQEPWQGTQSNQDISSLRKLVEQANRPQSGGQPEENKRDRGLVGRLAGMFSKR